MKTCRNSRLTLGRLRNISVPQTRSGISYLSTLMSFSSKMRNSRKPAKNLRRSRNITWRLLASTWKERSLLLSLRLHPQASKAFPTLKVLAREQPRRTTGLASTPSSARRSPLPPLATGASKKCKTDSTPSPLQSTSRARSKEWSSSSRPSDHERN